MKIGLLTVHVGSNFGSVLQTVATSKFLSDMGYDVDVINYIPPRMTILGFIRKRKGVFNKCKAILGLPIMGLNKCIYGGFLKKYVSLTKPFYNIKDVQSNCKYDAFIVGSDQVWNSIHNDGIDLTYYLNFECNNKRIAFSSSFGREELPEEEYIIVSQLLKRFSFISTREDSGVKILSKMGIKGAIQTIDPTFLLTKDEWTRYASQRLVKEPYLLIYTPYNIFDQSVINYTAKSIAEKNNLRIITFGWDIRKDRHADKTMLFSSPADFLSLMYFAEYVITNSFHGTAFSIILNKQFFVFPPTHFIVRINSILEFVGLNERLVNTGEEGERLLSFPVKYDTVNEKINSARKVAFLFLKRALNS